MRALVAAMAVVLLAACGSAPDPVHADGGALAARHCATCHALPDPALLPAPDWPAMVDWMGAYLGHPPRDATVRGAVAGELVPPEPVATARDLAAIAEWYRRQAPSRASVRARLPAPPAATARFAPVALPSGSGPAGSVTLAAITHGTLIVGATDLARLQLWDAALRPLLDAPLPTAPVAVERRDAGWRLSLMGHFAGDAGAGQVVDLQLDAGAIRAAPLVSDYHRLVQHHSADIDRDGSEDLLLVAFGDTPLGRLAILWGGGDEQILVAGAGCVGAVLRDVDGDGRLDIVVARAQQHSRLVALLQRDGRAFERRILLQRPAGWGYNQLLSVDIDGDGDEELLTVAGNNMEQAAPPLKAHHGLRILTIGPDLTLDERHFEPLPGATQATVADIDGDGDLDLAIAACYPDWAQDVPLTALLLEQRDGAWIRHRLPDTLWQRWLTVGSGDLDGDGTPELVFGAASFTGAMPAGARQRWGPTMAGRERVLVLRSVADW